VSQFHGFALDGFALTELDDEGCQWTVEHIDGWYTGGAVRTSAEPRPQQDGERRGKGYRAGRVITARGKLFAPNTVAMEQASRRLSSVLASGGFGEFLGTSDAGTFSAPAVQLVDEPFFDTWSDRIASWQLTVASEDPLLYGPALYDTASLASTAAGTGRTWPRVWPRDWGVPAGVTPGAVDLPNAGTATYWPTLRIDGPTTNPTVRAGSTGDFVTFNGTLTAGQWLDIDCANRRVLLNGQVSVRQQVSSGGSWLGVAPGGDSLTWTDDSGDAAAQLSVSFYEGAWS
jgi:hypothetical protein